MAGERVLKSKQQLLKEMLGETFGETILAGTGRKLKRHLSITALLCGVISPGVAHAQDLPLNGPELTAPVLTARKLPDRTTPETKKATTPVKPPVAKKPVAITPPAPVPKKTSPRNPVEPPGLTAPGLQEMRSVLVTSLPSEKKELEDAAPPAAGSVATHATALATITAKEYRKHVETLADDTLEGRDSGSRGGRAAGNYLTAELREYGLEGAAAGGSFVQTFQRKGRAMRNILAMLPGSDPQLRHEVIVIGAHYDHVGYGNKKTSRGRIGYIHNGADDNASGVAAVLETIEAIRALPAAPKRSIMVAFWDGEEQGLLGSKHWVSRPTIDMNRIAFVLNCDMIGRLTDKGVQVHGSRTAPGLRRLLAEANRDTALKLDFQWKLAKNSDHAPFADRQKPVLMFHTGLHEDYHTPRDDAHLINTKGATNITRLMFETLTRLANSETRFAFRQQAMQEDDAAEQQFAKPLPQPAPRLGMRWQRGDDGAEITAVTPGSAAARAKLEVGDRLLKFNGKAIDSDFAFLTAIITSPVDATAQVQRGDAKPETLEIRLDGAPLRVGISWREDPAEKGVMFVSRTVHGSPAHAANLRTGDRIHSVGGEQIRDIQHMGQLVSQAKEKLELVVERDGQIRRIDVQLP